MARDTNRRGFLKASAVLSPFALGAAIPALQKDPSPDGLEASAPADATPAADHYSPTFFTPAEWAFVNAACARIIPADHNGPGAVELGVPQFIDRQMATPYGEAANWYMQGPFFEAAPEFGYQSKLTPKQQYRLGVRAIDAWCDAKFGKAFADLEPARQDEVLKAVEAGKVKADDVTPKTFFTGFLLKNVMEGYFGDPMYGGNRGMAAWKMIGHPGARADFMEWVDKPAPYPYGPVDLHGRQG